MFVLFRWLLIDMAINRLLRHRRVQRYLPATTPMLYGQYPRGFARPAAYVVRRPLHSCVAGGCLTVLAMVLAFAWLLHTLL